MDARSSRRTGFTLIELLVVISIIALLVSILMPVLSKAREKSKAAVCMAHLRQWHSIILFFGGDNNNKFPDADWDNDGSSDPHGQWWIQPLLPYSDNPEILVCPTTTRRPIVGNQQLNVLPKLKTECWASRAPYSKPDPIGGMITYGSLAPNGWIMNNAQGGWSAAGDYFWNNLDIPRASEVPLFIDCRWVDAWPVDTDLASVTEDARTSQMHQYVLNRHNGAVNSVFADGSSRRVGLKGLWSLRWHKKFKRSNAQTADGAEWYWMSSFTNDH
ncbi:MAG: type II secretion system protein [Phycisphaerae bacterium]|nr:type II secretion system protein [Phycisphaerae bacterium]